METLDLLPDQSSYNVSELDATFLAAADGAQGFYSANVEGYKIISVQWTLSKEDYELFMEFYNARFEDMDSFQIELISEESLPTIHTAMFQFNTFSLAAQSGYAFTVKCTLLAKQVKRYVIVGTQKITEQSIPKVMEYFNIPKFLEV